MNIFLLFPIHLFSNLDNIRNDHVYLIEEPRFFTDFKYHRLKIAYHRATMKKYFDFLQGEKINVTYINFNDDVNKLYGKLNLESEKKQIRTYDLGDDILKRRLLNNINNLQIINTLNFTVNEKIINDNLKVFYRNGKYYHKKFYEWQRIRLNILVTKNNKPVGGKWSFDKDNRKKLPESIKIPSILHMRKDKYKIEAIEYTMLHFHKNYGNLENFIYPIDHEEALKWLDHFLKNKFSNFGIFEDAESMEDPFLFHSVLTPMMNIGLLTDTEVIKETLKYENKVPIASFEGFIRQIIGWRNYIYAIYLLEGEKMIGDNFLNNQNKIDKKIMWEGTTGIIPIDNIIDKIVNYAYAHHIERLMYLGNFMLLCMINPKDVYELFMEWTIDAYEWVMVPNVFGMSQFADGGKMMTKIYISSSNYILKMSNYKKKEWCKIYDSLYYNFIRVNEEYLLSDYASVRQVSFWQKKSEIDKREIVKVANEYLKYIYI